ncbi:MAG: YceI family protein, partial [Saprospiraceae bacterium]
VSFLFLHVCFCHAQSQLFVLKKGDASFVSQAPLETIKARTNSIQGLINRQTKEFAFSIKINTFEGFNSEIQRVHFLENYMEQTNYPKATFSGKLIEDIPFDEPGTYSVRAKGILDIHGVQKERIIRGTITINSGGAVLNTSFSVPVADHGITIPKIVRQKISEYIDVKINIEFAEGSKS